MKALLSKFYQKKKTTPNVAPAKRYPNDFHIGHYPDCFRACLASFVKRDISQVPCVFAGTQLTYFFGFYKNWLNSLGLTFKWTYPKLVKPNEYYIAFSGHAVITYGKVVVHDPFPESHFANLYKIYNKDNLCYVQVENVNKNSRKS